MADELKDNRHWWQKRTDWGIIIVGLSLPMYVIPFTMVVAPAVNSFGLLLAGYGYIERKIK
jgi:hypothetical protein